MSLKRYRPFIFLTIALMILSLACSLPFIGEVSITRPDSNSKTNTNSGTGLTKSDDKAITTLTDVHKAVIQIEAQGTFLDPEVGLEVNAAGRGSGFFISSSGLAVTNNHVVTGAALVKVWVDGEKEARNARVLGYSECNDLAVIQVEGDDFSYLNWYDGEIEAGTEIYLAGFPLGEPEFSLTKGIISKSHTSGDTSWTAVTGGVLVHDATSNPGNSGGPIVNADGQVLGVNFASRSDAKQYFAIPAATAKGVVEKLATGVDFESIGVNGTIVSNDDGTLTGVWVSSVASGSPADKTGLKPGDIITQIEGLVIGTDGTMNDYCSVIRTHDSTATLSLTVLRWSTQEVLEGQINGRELKVTGSFGGGTSSSDSSGSSSGGSSGSSASSGDYEYFVYGSNPSESELNIYTSDGKLTFEIHGDHWPYLYNTTIDASNESVNAVVENISGQQQDIKLFCRMTPDESWYEFKYISEGYIVINYLGSDGFEEIYNFETNNQVNTGSTDTYSATCNGDTLSMYIDGQLVAQTHDSRLSSGYAGVGVASDNSDANIVFDSLEISSN
jgi:S1-C subfamily serine protease